MGFSWRHIIGILTALSILVVIPKLFYKEWTIFHVVSYEVNKLVDRTKDWNQAMGENLSYKGPARLFHDLVMDFLKFDEKTGYFIFDSQTGQITLPDCNSLQYLENTENEKDRQRLLPLINRLCKTDTGKTVQAEVEAWNNANTVVAIRDNISKQSDWERIEWYSFERKILGNHDELADSIATGIYHRAAKIAVDGNFGLMGQWNVLDGFSAAGQPVVFKQPIRIKDGDVLHIQVVGNVTSVNFLDRDGQGIFKNFTSDILKRTQNEQIRRSCNLETALSKRSSQQNARFAERQTYFSKAVPCAFSDENSTHVSLKEPVLTPLTFDFGQRDLSAISELELTITAERAIPPSIAKLKNIRKPNYVSKELERLENTERSGSPNSDRPIRGRKVYQSGNIELRCETRTGYNGIRSEFNNIDECWLAWAGGGTSPNNFLSATRKKDEDSAPKFKIFASDGTTVLASTDDNCFDCEASWVSKTANKLGLTAWLGHSKEDTGGLANVYEAHVNARGSYSELKLTIDIDLQEKVESVLQQIIDKKFGQFTEYLPKEHDENRLISIMLLNKRGEILASTNWPRIQVQDEINYWDVAALEDNGYDYLSPLATRGWSALNQTMQPGSTFKVMSGLAILQAFADSKNPTEKSGVGNTNAERNDLIYNVVRGDDANTIKNRIGVNKCQKKYADGKKMVDCLHHVTKLRNSNGTSFENHAASDQFQVNCSFDTPFRSANTKIPVGHIGFREAFAKSSNIWFGGILKDADIFGAEIADPNHAFRRVIDKLDILKITNGTLVSHSEFGELSVNRLRPQPIVADFKAIRGDLNFLKPTLDGAFVRATIGQQVQASPLALAALMASVANGYVVRPTITINQEHITQNKTPLFDNAQSDSMLNELRCAMKGVVHSGGTAAQAFANLDPSILNGLYAKTGTAQTAANDLFVGWLSGYQKRIDTDETLSFACMISHSTKPGGSVCGPAIRKLLEEINK